MALTAAEAGVAAPDSEASKLRVALAHEWLVRYAGSERVVEQIRELFPDSRLLATFRDDRVLPPSLKGSDTSVLQTIPGAMSHHEWFLPLMPLDWRLRRRVDNVDVVISSSHACAKAVRVASPIPHVCYCHTPMRYAWDFRSEEARFPAALRPAARSLMVAFRRWDRQTSTKVDLFIANSTAVAARIERFYRRRAAVIHPPVRTGFFTPEGEPQGFFLYVGRLTGYKRPDLVVEAFRGCPYQLVVVGSGPLREKLEAMAPTNVSFRGNVGDEELRRLYREAQALVYPVDEDFGITMAEAQACGTPVIGLRSGGAVDIVRHGETGWLIPRQTLTEVRKALDAVTSYEFHRASIAHSAERFSTQQFKAAMSKAVMSAIENKSSPADVTRARR